MSAYADVHVHRDPPDVVGRRDRMGVLLLIVADIAFVLCLMFSYLYLRFLNVNGLWLPEEVSPAPDGMTWIINAILIVGALVFVFGVRAMRAGRTGAFVGAAAVALILAIVALVMQYVQLSNFGFPAAENGYFASAYSSSIVILSGANLFHIFLTVVISLGMVTRGRMGKFAAPAAWQPRLGMYWWIWVAVSAVLVGLMTTFYVHTPFPPSM